MLRSDSITVDKKGVKESSLPREANLFSKDKIEVVIKNMGVASAPGPDGLKVREMKKTPTAVCTIIFSIFFLFPAYAL